MSSALPVISFAVPANYRSISLSGISAAHLRSIRRRSNFKSLSCKCQVPDAASATSAAYGALLLGGGLFAFNKSKSKGSLLGGLTGATLMATAYFLMQAQETKAVGDALGFGSAFLFSSVFVSRSEIESELSPILYPEMRARVVEASGQNNAWQFTTQNSWQLRIKATGVDWLKLVWEFYFYT